MKTRKEIALDRIFHLMDVIENKSGKMYHQFDAVTFYQIMERSSEKNFKYSFIIEKLSKQLDVLNKGVNYED